MEIAAAEVWERLPGVNRRAAVYRLAVIAKARVTAPGARDATVNSPDGERCTR